VIALLLGAAAAPSLAAELEDLPVFEGVLEVQCDNEGAAEGERTYFYSAVLTGVSGLTQELQLAPGASLEDALADEVEVRVVGREGHLPASQVLVLPRRDAAEAQASRRLSRPVQFIFLLDTSLSMDAGGKFEEAVGALGGLLDGLEPLGDHVEVAIAPFACDYLDAEALGERLQSVPEARAELAALERAVLDGWRDGRSARYACTALFNAVAAADAFIRAGGAADGGPAPRRVLVTLSDGVNDLVPWGGGGAPWARGGAGHPDFKWIWDSGSGEGGNDAPPGARRSMLPEFKRHMATRPYKHFTLGYGVQSSPGQEKLLTEQLEALGTLAQVPNADALRDWVNDVPFAELQELVITFAVDAPSRTALNGARFEIGFPRAGLPPVLLPPGMALTEDVRYVNQRPPTPEERAAFPACAGDATGAAPWLRLATTWLVGALSLAGAWVLVPRLVFGSAPPPPPPSSAPTPRQPLGPIRLGGEPKP